VPATSQVPRWFVDENSLGVAKALAYVRGDVTWPGAPGGPVPAGAADTAWLPVIGEAGLVVLTRDKRIRSRPLERQALLNSGVRACFLTSGGSLDLFSQLRLWLRYWDDIEALVAEQPAPWLASVTRAGVRIFDARQTPGQSHGPPPADIP
jgi:PIN like domain